MIIAGHRPTSPAVVRGSGTQAAPNGPRDSFVGVPTSMTATELRAVTVASMRAACTKPAQKIDLEKIPFGVEIEMEHFDEDQAKPFVEGLPTWNVHPSVQRWRMVPDASLSSKTGGEAVSPVMTLENGEAEKQIREVLTKLKSLGGKMTRNCGLHVHVDARVLGEKGLTNLMRIALEQEHAMFRLSQNGYKEHRGTLQGHGYRHNTPYYYGKPLSRALPDAFDVLHAQSPNEFRNALYGAIPADPHHPRPAVPDVSSSAGFKPDHRDSVRYFGINLNSYWYMGTVEFRLFEATDNPEQLMETVQTALGIIKAAAEDDYAYLQTQALSPTQNVPVSKESFEYFLDKVAHTPAHKDRMRQTFEKSGGVVKDDPVVTDPVVMHASYLLEDGVEFTAAGKRLHSPLEIADLMKNGRHPVAAGGQPVGRLEDLQRVLKDNETSAAADPAEMKRLDGLLDTLRKGNCAPLVVRDGSPMRLMSRRAVYAALKEGALLCPTSDRAGDFTPIKTLDDLQRAADIVGGNDAALDAESGAQLRQLVALGGKGVRFRTAGAEHEQTLNRLGQLEQLKAGRLAASLPQRIPWAWGLRTKVDIAGPERLAKLASKLGVAA